MSQERRTGAKKKGARAARPTAEDVREPETTEAPAPDESEPAEGEAADGAPAEGAPAEGAPAESDEAAAPGAPDAAPPAEPPAVAATFRDWVAGARLPREMAILFGLVMPAMLLAANIWRVHTFTVDDSYISFRYARNLARGLGLVYNEGERIEGYTNFLWTVLLAGGIKLGIDPNVLSKVLGAASAFGSLTLTYALSARLQPHRTLPCVATWLLASTVLFSGYAVFGLETGAFVCLILAGTYLFLRENDVLFRPHAAPRDTPSDDARGGPYRERSAEPAAADAPPGFPWSGLVFALAGLTRPEAPMYIGILMIFLGRRFFARQNLLRGALFVAPIAAHLLWRHAYYGAWVPNTLSAKTGNIEGQLNVGVAYVQNYVHHAGPIVYFALLGLAIGVVSKRRDLLALGVIGLGVMGYVILVGGDWMKYFRFLAPFEPFCFLLVDVGVRRVVDRRDAATNLAVALFGIAMVSYRGGMLRDAQADLLQKEKHFWDMAAGGTATWLKQNTTPGEIAIGDIGQVGWETDYPILDLLGLVDPVISKLPGGYTQKLGPGFNERFFDKKPKYMLLISSSVDCQHPSVPGSQVIYRDRRFLPLYAMAGRVPLEGGFAWCIYKKKE